jgi:hypothetical protein
MVFSPAFRLATLQWILASINGMNRPWNTTLGRLASFIAGDKQISHCIPDLHSNPLPEAGEGFLSGDHLLQVSEPGVAGEEPSRKTLPPIPGDGAVCGG